VERYLNAYRAATFSDSIRDFYERLNHLGEHRLRPDAADHFRRNADLLRPRPCQNQDSEALMPGYLEIEKEAAIRAATEQAFHEGEEYGDRVIVHGFLNGWIGADWDLDEVVKLLSGEDVEGVYWQDGVAGHDLCVRLHAQGGMRQYNFDVKRPAGVLA
jgi:hypothetical protein